MPRKTDKRERRRVSPDRVRKTAASKGGFSQLQLPGHIKEWCPDKDGWFVLRLVPFAVEGFNPDDIEKGADWYRYRYGVHRRIAGGTIDAICPRSVGKRCPICDEADKLSENYDQNKELIKNLRPTKMMVCFAILPSEDENQIVAFNWNMSKFGETLDKEIKMAEEEHLSFYWDEDGWVLKIRIIEEEYMGRKYLTTDKIDFKDAKHLATLSDEILDKVSDPINFLIVKTEQEIEAMFLGLEPEDVSASEEKSSPKPKPAPKPEGKPKPAPKSKPEPEPEPEEDDDDSGAWGDEDAGDLGPVDDPQVSGNGPDPEPEEDDDDDW